MKLGSIGPVGAEIPVARVDEDSIVSLGPFLERLGVRGDMNAVLGLMSGLRAELEAYIAAAPRTSILGSRIGPPVPRPRNLIAVGANTHSHVEEAAAFTGGYSALNPMLIIKSTTSVCGPYDNIIRPTVTEKLDYETELAVVIGRHASRVSAERAMEHVAGYMASSDVTARDVQMGEGEDSDFYWQHAKGKSYETFTPIGPWLVTPDEVSGSVEGWTLESYVNGTPRQQSTLADLVASIPNVIASITGAIPLYPGDIVLTGSPAGVGAFHPDGYLRPGDVLTTRIEPIGELMNIVVDAPR